MYLTFSVRLEGRLTHLFTGRSDQEEKRYWRFRDWEPGRCKPVGADGQGRAAAAPGASQRGFFGSAVFCCLKQTSAYAALLHRCPESWLPLRCRAAVRLGVSCVCRWSWVPPSALRQAAAALPGGRISLVFSLSRNLNCASYNVWENNKDIL